MLIQKANIEQDILQGANILLTGGAGGIGFETARALSFLGANVIIADIDKKKGRYAEKIINQETNSKRILFYYIDITNQTEINRLYKFVEKRYSFLDIIINNATITPVGAVDKTVIADWDKSYSVNLKAPVMLIQKFLPQMKAKNRGTIVFVSSSGASPYLGAYEVLKTAQVELCNTLTYELENSAINTFTISPGLVQTETAQKAIEIVSKNMNVSINDFYAMNKNFILDCESAGVGFALSVLKATDYNGQEIGAIQVLTEFGLVKPQIKTEPPAGITEKKQYLRNIIQTFEEQYSGWQSMNVFQKQWVLRDFKKTTGLSADQTLDKLKVIEKNIESLQDITEELPFFGKLKEYWHRQLKLLQGFEKDKEKLKRNTQIILSWINDIENFLA